MCLSLLNDVIIIIIIIIVIIDINMNNTSVLQVLVLNCTDKKNIIQWNLFFEMPLFNGHFHSGDAKFGPGEIFI